MYFYHVYGAFDDKEKIYQALKEGITQPQTFSNTASRGGGSLYPEIINRIKADDVDCWMDFTKSFSVMFSPKNSSNYIRFPLSTKNSYTFNLDITIDIFAYIEDEYMEDEDGPGSMTAGLPSKETLLQQYWESRMTLADYLDKKPYPKAEIIIFQDIPSHVLEGFIDKKKV